MTSRWRLLTLDLDDTLWPCAPTIDAAEAAFHAWLEQHAPRLAAVYDLPTLRRHRRLLSAEQPAIAHDMTAIRLESLRRLLAEFGYDPALAEPAVALFCDWRNRVMPYPEVPAVLAALKTQYQLISLTNGNAEVSCTPLRELFDFNLTAAAVGAAKPHPALFTQAMAWAGTDPSTTLHIGDDPVRDIAAAQQLGMAAIWVNRNAETWPQELAPPLLEIQELTALQNWLATNQP